MQTLLEMPSSSVYCKPSLLFMSHVLVDKVENARSLLRDSWIRVNADSWPVNLGLILRCLILISSIKLYLFLHGITPLF